MIFLQNRNLYNPHGLHGVHVRVTRSVLWILRQDKRLLTSMEWNLRLKLVTYHSMWIWAQIFVKFQENNSWTHVKEISSTGLLVSLHHCNDTSANMSVFDISKKGKARKIYSFEEVSAGIHYLFSIMNFPCLFIINSFRVHILNGNSIH